ncbi:LysE family translocator [Larsenimonas rhizosphaerae]|uniref:LysE family translocator n=1 Tax=Larsenimonas rhizosphaerae TaxID=2944682 RepID=A0AA41ZGJ0_9GAMM|nr:LysE family translocator [Larsenimonas rhizosphaerae]MCX2524236.1 LysE family translocator [Larsenimonas rhizosphaerae]
MFDYSLMHWTTFFSAALLLNISPGPDMAFILGQTAKGGKSAGLAAMFGIWSGAFVHALMAALGLSAVLASSATAFAVVKWAGAAYLIWLGLQSLCSKSSPFTAEAAHCALSQGKIWRQGLLVSVMNPKVAVFFLAFLPQFVVHGAGPIAAQLFLHGVLIIAVAGLVELPLVYLGARLSVYFRRHPAVGLWLDRTMGGVLVALGARLAASER